MKDEEAYEITYRKSVSARVQCAYCGTYRLPDQLHRGVVFGNLICDDRQACDQAKAQKDRAR